MKVLPFKIPKPVDSTLVVQVDKAKIFYNQLHQHAETQISYIVKGQGKLIVANSVYGFKTGDVFIIGSNTPHLFQSVPSKDMSHMITLFATTKNFEEDSLGIPELEEVKQFIAISSGGIQVMSKKKSIRKIMLELPTASKLGKFVKFLKIIQEINSAEVTQLTSYVPSKKIISNTEGRRLQLVFDYAMNNFDKEITLNYVADLVHMTTPAFCRFFKQRTNKTFFEFLIELRLEHACQLLSRDDKMSIAEISEASGFQSISNFNRKFKKIKLVSPSQYSKQMRPVLGS